MLFLGTDNASATANQFPKNKKIKENENSKIKNKKYCSQPTPVLLRYNFFDEICTLVSPGVRTAYLMPRMYIPLHHPVFTCDYGIYYSFKLTLKLICRGG
jgi:hypothetical protein